jgi:thymidylate synthase (FAD)
MNDQVEFRSSIDVELIRHFADDEHVVQAARVSSGTDLRPGGKTAPLISALMRDRHGSPFEHGMFTFRVHAPIFVFREWHRHRVGWSYNEQSGRYTEFKPVFYLPDYSRPLVQSGKPMNYDLRAGTEHQHRCAVYSTQEVCRAAWAQYQDMIGSGIAREVARNVLPVSTYSSMYATCNPRSLMHFLSLRTADVSASYPSKPQWEIDRAARELESHFMDTMPVTWAAWNEHGRVAP